MLIVGLHFIIKKSEESYITLILSKIKKPMEMNPPALFVFHADFATQIAESAPPSTNHYRGTENEQPKRGWAGHRDEQNRMLLVETNSLHRAYDLPEIIDSIGHCQCPASGHVDDETV